MSPVASYENRGRFMDEVSNMGISERDRLEFAPAARSIPECDQETEINGSNALAVSRDGQRLLHVQGIEKTFGGTRALRNVSFSLFGGEVLALLGENGAGKSTLIKILAGVHPLEEGTILFEGCDVGSSVADLPIAFIHQDLGLIEWMTVLENVCLTRGFARSYGLISWKASRAAAVAALDALGVDIDPDTRVAQLGRTERSLVAIARALSTNARIVVMDEPTASLPADEVARLFAAVRMLRARGVGIIYVSHRLEEIFAIADRVVVLRDGSLIGESEVADISPEALIHMIVGRSTSTTPKAPAPRNTSVALDVDKVVVGEVGPVSLRVQAGEMVALTGLRGAGQEAIGRALFGMLPLNAGTVRVAGQVAELTSPAKAMRHSVRYVSGDRNGESVVQGFSISENFYLNPRAAGRRLLSRLQHGAEQAAARELGRYVRLSPNDPIARIEALSGGNQQKVVIGRWLHLKGRLLILEDPTAGVDVGAKAEIYRLLLEALADGLAIILISTDFVEVASLCRRALVFSRGQIVCELADEAISSGALLRSASMTTA
jgi:ribose transport system ATP-binding protein